MRHLLAACPVLHRAKAARLQDCKARTLYHRIIVKVVALASQKGGSGKTTLACSLAVVAGECGLSVALADADPQGSSAAWYERRGVLVGPDVVRVSRSAVRDAVQLARERYELLLLDTAGRMTASNDALALADLVLVPCRPAIADIDAAVRTHSAASRIARSTAFVLAQVPGRGERRAQQAEDALSALAAVAAVRVGMRNAYADALALGLGVTEFEPRGKAATEMRELWSWVAGQLEEIP